MTTIEKDICIIGAGPSGLFMVFEAGFLGYSCVVVDSLEEIGGQLATLYPEKPIYDIPGIPKILAGKLVQQLEEQAAPYEPVYLLNSPAKNLQKLDDGSFTLETDETTIKAKVIVIAAGGGMFSPRKPKLDNVADFEGGSDGRGVFYAVKKKEDYRDKTLIIAGGGDSAVDWAVELADVATHIHVVHRRPNFRAAEETVKQMHALAESGKVTLHAPADLVRLNGENGQIASLTVKKDGAEEEITADAMLCFYGLIPTLGPLDDWGLEMSDNKKILVDRPTMQTGVPGILAIGDIADYDGKISLILVGFAEAASAAKQVQSIINPEKKFKVVYSTSKGVPGETTA